MNQPTDASLIRAADAADVVQTQIKNDLLSYREADPDRKLRIKRAMSEIDLKDTNSIIYFGTKAQEQLTVVSDQILEGVRTKQLGPAGEALNRMVATLRGFGADDLETPRFFGRLFGAANPAIKFLQRYEDVRRQIDAISNDLDHHKTRLLTDIISLDRLYEANLEYFHLLADYIAAGDEKLRELDEEILPSMERQVQASGDMVEAQRLRDVRATRDDLERRVHDLKLTRQVTMQSLPSIRLVQENDKALVTKINSVMANTIPLWRTQLAQALTIQRSREAGQTLKAATDLTNELLLANAENLKIANAEVRRQVERGVFDIEAVKKANLALIDTIEEGLRIADEGKRKRAQAESELRACEAELRSALSAAHPRAQSTISSNRPRDRRG